MKCYSKGKADVQMYVSKKRIGNLKGHCSRGRYMHLQVETLHTLRQ